jgi:dolichol kinase
MIRVENVERSYGAEVIRKGIHLCSLTIPVIYYFVTKSTALFILAPLTAAFLITDLARLYHEPTGRLFGRLFGFLLRSHEQNDRGRRLTGASYVLLSATFCILIFPKIIAITAFSIMIVSDSAAALIGRRFGRHPFMKKSAEGTIAFFLSALIVVALAPKIGYLPVEYVIGGIASLVGALVEAWPTGIDDNVSIPFSIGAAMWLLYSILLPALDLFKLDTLL